MDGPGWVAPFSLSRGVAVQACGSLMAARAFGPVYGCQVLGSAMLSALR